MSDLTDQQYLLKEQYRDASNLNARIRLHKLYSVNPRSLHEWIFDKLLELEGLEMARILEVGCGPGQLWLNNLDRVPEAWDVTLSDFSPGMLDEARRNLAGAPHPFTFKHCDAQDLPFPDGTFDVGVANYMLYHVPDRRKAIGEMARALRPGGRLYAVTLGLGHLKELNDLLHRFDPDAGPLGGRFTELFSLENGAGQLAEHFSQVEMLRFEDALVVTEVEPLVDYVLSASYGGAFTGDKLSQLTAYFRELIARDGAIRISKVSGLFMATKRA